jgi:beta-lactam-binding protein with PASTA domain/Tol biopolymer transport system component
VRVCPSCKHENSDDLDFCEECNTYLRWEPTMFAPSPSATGEQGSGTTSPGKAQEPDIQVPGRPAGQVAQQLPVIKPEDLEARVSEEAPPAPAPAPTPAPTAEAPAAADSVLITLRLPGDEGAGSAAAATQVDPGGQTVVLALVRNQSGIVDNYDLAIEGMPAEWWTIAPSTVYLVPYGAPGGEYEQEVEIRLHPPRTAEAEARPWHLQMTATSKAHDVQAGSAVITATITPFHELETEIRPQRARGRRRGNFAIAVRNRANAPAEVAFAGVDSENASRFDFANPTVSAPPGRRAGTTFRVVPNKPIWIGKPADRRFEVTASVPGSEAPAPRQGAVYRQKPWIPLWVPFVLPILAAAAAAVLLLLPNTTTVPDLKGLRVIDAQKRLESKGLALGEKTDGKPTDKQELIGTIDEQSKPAGAKVKKGSAISVTLRVGGPVSVPELRGKSLNDARKALDPLKLQVGTMTPVPTDADKSKIVSQSPAAGDPASEGSTVDLWFPATKESGETTTEGGKKKQKPAKGSITVPAIGSLTATAMMARLTDLGLQPELAGAINEAKRGTLVGLNPGPKTPLAKGAPIQVLVSVGFPQVAFDDAHDVWLMNGATGKGVKPVAASADTEDEPNWRPNGKLIAYRRSDASASRIWLVNPDHPSSAHQLTDGPDDRRPAFSPDGKVLAFIRGTTGGDQDLCFLRMSAPASVTCLTDQTVWVDRPAWSPDGKTILALATANPVGQAPVELAVFTSTKPNASQKSKWSFQGPVTNAIQGNPQPGDVLYVSWAPDGTQVAFTADWGARFFSVYRAPVTPNGLLGKAVPLKPRVQACEVVWRPDSKELAIRRADSYCQSATGAILHVDPTKPSDQPPLRNIDAGNPAWQPVDLTPR